MQSSLVDEMEQSGVEWSSKRVLHKEVKSSRCRSVLGFSLEKTGHSPKEVSSHSTHPPSRQQTDHTSPTTPLPTERFRAGPRGKPLGSVKAGGGEIPEALEGLGTGWGQIRTGLDWVSREEDHERYRERKRRQVESPLQPPP